MKKLYLLLLLFVSFSYSYAQTATLTNNSGTNAAVNITVGGTATLRVTFTGTGPWNFALYDGRNFTYYTATSSPFLISVSPASKRRYSLKPGSLTTNSGTGTAFGGFVDVIVGTNPTITMNTPSNTSTCVGGMIEIPYTENGTWQAGNRSIQVNVLNAAGTITVQSGGGNTYHTNPIKFQMPANIPAGTYKIQLFSDFPYVASTLSSYTVTVTNSGCQTPQASIYPSNTYEEQCIFQFLNATPNGAGYTYEWFRNGTSVATNVGNAFYFPNSAGNYTVRVTNSSAGYDQTSSIYNAQFDYLTSISASPNGVLCGGNNSATLTSSMVGSRYQWFKNTNGGYKAIIGANSISYVATSIGSYKVDIYNGDCTNSSFRTITNVASSKLYNANNQDGTGITIPPNTSTVIKAELDGFGPWTFQMSGTDNSLTNHTATTSPYYITVSPTQNTVYRLINLSNSCGTGSVSSYQIAVTVSPPPTFAITSTSSLTSEVKPSNFNTNICPGSTIPITYTTSGTWSADRQMTVELLNSTTNAAIAGTTQTGYATNPILYHVPSTLVAGTYKVQLTSIKPFISTPVVSSAITISSTACAAPQATIKSISSCSNAVLTAAPAEAGYTFQWFKDGNSINNATQSIFTATESGNYTVTVANAATSYSSTSAAFAVAVNQINGVVTATSGQICETASSITLSSSNSGGSYTHQWYYSPNNFYFEPIASATSNTYTTSVGGFYYDIIKNGACEVKSNTINTCPISINFIDKTVCNNSSVSVPFTFLGGENQNITLQLVNAATNAIVVSNLLTLVSTNTTTYNPTVVIPNAIPAGNYKFKTSSGSPSNYSNTSLGIITISGQTGGVAPTVTASVNTVSSAQNVTITSTGCQFDVNWNNSDGNNPTTASFIRLVNKNSTFAATCTDINTGCISLAGSTAVTYSCTDAYEPNNTTAAATSLASNSFVSPVICLNGFDNPDWFAWSLNGHIYYIKVSLTSSLVSAGNYKLGLTYSNSNLVIETLPETVGQSLDTYLTLFDTDGVTVLASDDNGNANGFSKISIPIISTVCLLNASMATGLWSSSSLWSCGHIPLATEPVQISSGHTITLDVNGTAKSLDLRGILNKQATKVLTIQGN